MLDMLERSGWLNAFKIVGGITMSVAVLVPACLYVLAGA